MAEDIFENMLAKMDITQRQRAVLRASMELFATPFIEVFEYYQKQGKIREGLTMESIVQLMISTILGYTTRMILFGQHFDPHTAADEGTSLVMHGIANS